LLNIAICDDEKYYREHIQQLLIKYLDNYLIDYNINIFSSGKEFCEQGCGLAKYDIVFLDISMDEINGIETAYKIRTVNMDTYIVFVTGFISYVLEGYKVNAIRYILKETAEVSIVECMDTILRKMEFQMKKIEISFIEGKKQVYPDKIHYIESQKHKLIFNILESNLNKYCVYDKLDNFELQLKEYGFLRIHKSYLVNMKHIEGINNYKVKLITGEVFSIPKLRYQAVKEAYVLYKGELW
jgi:DNA-binding LytR/AlgR family response regulator